MIKLSSVSRKLSCVTQIRCTSSHDTYAYYLQILMNVLILQYVVTPVSTLMGHLTAYVMKDICCLRMEEHA